MKLRGASTEDSQSFARDESWEDMDSDTENRGSLLEREGSASFTTISSRSSTPTTPRRRRAGSRIVHAASPSPRKAIVRKERAREAYTVGPSPKTSLELEKWQRRGQDALHSGAFATAEYAWDTLWSTLRYLAVVVRLLQKPLALMLCLWLILFLFSRLFDTVRTAFAPLCVLPGMSLSPLCAPVAGPGKSGAAQTPKWANFTRLSEMQSKTFEQLLDDSAGGSGLALEIKKAEMATSDLATLVRVSELTSKDLLASTLVDFVDDAKKAGRGLQKFGSKVGGAVDQILAVNDYALHAIEAASAKPSSLSLRALWPFSGPPPGAAVATRTFTEAMEVLSGSMERLVLEAEVSLANLDALEQRLATLHELVAREDSTLSAAHADLLADLWTRLGGNRRRLRGVDSHLRLLRELGSYRKRALAHVAGALQTLQAMAEDMEELRERVAAPELAGEKIPVEVHMRSIRGGLERLKEGRVRAKQREEEAVRQVLGISGGDDDDVIVR